jgi:hypothetical protein
MTNNITRPSLDQFDLDLALPATAAWKARRDQKTPHVAPADKRLLDRDLFTAAQFRTGNRYPRQRNYHGYYWHTTSSTQLWHESLLERRTMMWLDFSHDIVAIAAQPFELQFADGTIHVPDFIALHADDRQVVYDVKPRRLHTDAFIAQTQKTQAACDAVGWSYEVHAELPKAVASNLDWLSLFRHPRFHPGHSVASRLADDLAEPVSINDAAALLGIRPLGNARAAVYHLIWEHILDADLTLPLSTAALIRKGPHAHA